MNNRELLNFMYGMARNASMEARELKPGEVGEEFKQLTPTFVDQIDDSYQ